MDARTVVDVGGWESRPFDGGYDGLHDLAAREFTGGVVAGDSYLFMTRGRVVGVFDYAEPSMGDPSLEPVEIDRFEGADGTAHEAPHDALPLLFAMVASDGETRGRYYSKDTPLEEVDRTLRDGGFTGYLELSENVLSGDYYLVYHGGRRRTVAFVGQSRRLKVDEEAFDLAADEVGIYEVNAVPLSTVEIPGSGGGDGAAVPDAGPAPTRGDDDPDGRDVPTGRTDAGTSSDPSEPGAEASPGSDSDSWSGSGTADTGDEGGPSRPEIDLDAALNPGDDDPIGNDEAEADDAEPTEGTESTEPDGVGDPEESEDVDTDGPGEPGPDDDPDPDGEAPVEVDDPVGEATPEDVEAAAVAAEADLETETETETETTSESGTDRSDTGSGPDGASGAGPTNDGVEEARVVPSVDPDRTERAEPAATEVEATDRQVIDGETVAGLRSELSAREARIEELHERLEAAEAERDEIESERNRLEERVSELERRLEESGAAPIENVRGVPPAEALSGTSVLVRYRSKSDPTLADAHEGGAKREALAENLVLEAHPSFDTEGVSVSGRTFDAFLESTQAYAFLRWLVGGFLYEIRDTDSTSALKPLYDALPTLDRVEFDATVTLEGTDRETTRFDLVGRDRRGNPLLVALLEDDRAPTNAATMGEFLRDATAAAESHESLVGAFAVTASYFEPEALETAEQATGGSLLSRSKRKSFVKTSRKGGYHLCLVEDREESFYLSEPEL